jgi:hypothetical protein
MCSDGDASDVISRHITVWLCGRGSMLVIGVVFVEGRMSALALVSW